MTRIPPQNLDAERCVLGSILLLNDAIDDIAAIVGPDDFYRPSHQLLFETFLEMHGRGCVADAVTITEELSANGKLEEAGGVPYIGQILTSVPHAAHARYYANIVREKATQRAVIYGLSEVIDRAYDATDETSILSEAESAVLALADGRVAAGRPKSMAECVAATAERVKMRLADGRTVTGLRTGFRDIDSITTGLQPAELIVLAARPSMGKTALMCNIADGAVQNDAANVLVFSLEQSAIELTERLCAGVARINAHSLRSGKLTAEGQARFELAIRELSSLSINIDDEPSRSMAQISSIARRFHRQKRLNLIIIDYLQLIEPEEKGKGISREQQVATITRRLKGLAKQLDVPIVALAQLNRGVELRDNKRPRLSDLRESGAIEQDADIVMFLHRPDAYDASDRPGEAELVIAKHRSGPVGIVNLTWAKEFMRFENYCPDVSGAFE